MTKSRYRWGLLLGLFIVQLSGCESRHIELISKTINKIDSASDTSSSNTTDSTSDIDAKSASTATVDFDTASETAFDTEVASDSEWIDSESAEACRFGLDSIRVTEIDMGATVVANEKEAELKPIVISPIPGGGSRLAWMGDDNTVRVTTLNAADEITENSISIPANDFQDLYATADGGVLLLTRDARGGGVRNCGDENNLCNIPNPPIPCFDMYMVRFDESKEVWAASLTGSSETLPPYSTGPTGAPVTMIWWYAHHGRIASSGNSFAAYFGSAISVSTGGCIDIHQGDRMRIVDEEGDLIDGGFDWGCSPSDYAQVIWNSKAHAYVSVCRSEIAGSGVVAFAPEETVIWNVNPRYSNVGELVLAKNGGYWITLSDRKRGQPEHSKGLAEVHLLQITFGTVNIQETISLGDNDNVRAPHIALFSEETLLLLYESSTSPGELAHADDRTAYVELRSRQDASKVSDTITIPNFTGHRYHTLSTFDDGSVAMAVKGDFATTIKILRILPCAIRGDS